jgi:hypothetical protein
VLLWSAALVPSTARDRFPAYVGISTEFRPSGKRMSLVVSVPQTSVKTHTMVTETISFSPVRSGLIYCAYASIVVVLDYFYRFLSLDSFTIVVIPHRPVSKDTFGLARTPLDLTGSTQIDDSADCTSVTSSQKHQPA